MRTCQPHISISWNFPPPLSPLISSISFGLTHTASFTMDSLQDHCSRYRASQGLREEPDDRCPHCPCSRKGVIIPHQTLVSPKISLHLRQPVWLCGGGGLHLCSEKWPVDCASLGSKFLQTADGRSGEPWLKLTQQAGRRKPPPAKWIQAAASFHGLKANLNDKDVPVSAQLSWLHISLSHQRSHHIEHLWGMFN